MNKSTTRNDVTAVTPLYFGVRVKMNDGSFDCFDPVKGGDVNEKNGVLEINNGFKTYIIENYESWGKYNLCEACLHEEGTNGRCDICNG